MTNSFASPSPNPDEKCDCGCHGETKTWKPCFWCANQHSYLRALTAQALESLESASPSEPRPLCDVCEKNPSIGECCCGVKYCGVICQEKHLDVAHEEEESND